MGTTLESQHSVKKKPFLVINRRNWPPPEVVSVPNVQPEVGTHLKGVGNSHWAQALQIPGDSQGIGTIPEAPMTPAYAHPSARLTPADWQAGFQASSPPPVCALAPLAWAAGLT